MKEEANLNLFKIIRNTEGKFIIVTGGIQASKIEFETEETAKEYINGRPWELIFALILAVKLNEEKIKEQETKISE